MKILMLLYVLLLIIVFLILLFVESFLLSTLGVSLVFVLFLFAFKKVDWKLLLLATLLVSIFIDVTLNIPLGATMLVYVISILLYHVLSFSLSTETGVYAYVFKFLTFLFFNFAYLFAQNFFSVGNGGYMGWERVGIWLIRSVVAVLLVFLLEKVVVRFRGSKSKSNLRFK
jgi:hypothetical protein